jgi:hypothetical protein
MTIGFHSPILGWKDTDLGALFVIVRLTKLSEWWVDDSMVSSDLIISLGCESTLLMPILPYTDPTTGQVKYFSRANAQEKGLAYVQQARPVR